MNNIADFTKLMVVGGFNQAAYQDVEVISLDGSGQTCAKPIDFPGPQYGMTGTYFDGSPIVCGGNQFQSECYKYNVQVKFTFLQVKSFIVDST